MSRHGGRIGRALGARLRWGVIAAAALAGSGCDFDLVAPEASGVAPARLWIDFRFLESLGAVTGQVALRAGSDFDGPRRVPDERLWMDGTAVEAEPVIGEALLYDVSAELIAAGPIIRLAPPAIEGLRVEPDTVRVRRLGLSAPDTLVVRAGEAIRLDVEGCCEDALDAGPDFAVYRTEGSWRAVIQPDSAGRDAGITPVSISVDGAPGPEITIPASLLDPALRGGTLDLTVMASVGLRTGGGRYEVELWQQVARSVAFRVVADPAGP